MYHFFLQKFVFHVTDDGARGRDTTTQKERGWGADLV